MELDGEPCAKTVGSMEVAWTPERLTDLKRKAGYGMSWGVDAHLISPDEARDRIPMLSDRILGAIYVPSDIHTRATRPAEAMAREAERNGATFYGGVKVTGFGIADSTYHGGPYHTRRHRDGSGCRRRRYMGAQGRLHGRCTHTSLAHAAPLRRYHTPA